MPRSSSSAWVAAWALACAATVPPGVVGLIAPAPASGGAASVLALDRPTRLGHQPHAPVVSAAGRRALGYSVVDGEECGSASPPAVCSACQDWLILLDASGSLATNDEQAWAELRGGHSLLGLQ